jgi:hypothetical protein
MTTDTTIDRRSFWLQSPAVRIGAVCVLSVVVLAGSLLAARSVGTSTAPDAAAPQITTLKQPGSKDLVVPNVRRVVAAPLPKPKPKPKPKRVPTPAPTTSSPPTTSSSTPAPAYTPPAQSSPAPTYRAPAPKATPKPSQAPAKKAPTEQTVIEVG